MIEPFLCRVSSAGVPHTITHSKENKYTISGLSADDMCKLYWTLNAINIHYSFNINGINVTRAIIATTEVIPKNRIIAPVEFYSSGYDSELNTSYLCNLFFDPIYLLDDDTLGIKFLFNEIDETSSIDFNILPKVGMENISYDFTFLNVPAKVYLNYNSSVVSEADIESFSVDLIFAS